MGQVKKKSARRKSRRRPAPGLVPLLQALDSRHGPGLQSGPGLQPAAAKVSWDSGPSRCPLTVVLDGPSPQQHVATYYSAHRADRNNLTAWQWHLFNCSGLAVDLEVYCKSRAAQGRERSRIRSLLQIQPDPGSEPIVSADLRHTWHPKPLPVPVAITGTGHLPQGHVITHGASHDGEWSRLNDQERFHLDQFCG
ncbi:hypothetical protein F5B20DRAFT_110911 [Whalleya microplaca]|nr:hypothetical protein F5B20DRAFT_110911 [Whalleya microplaca]